MHIVINGKSVVLMEAKNGKDFFEINSEDNSYSVGQKFITENRKKNFEIEITGFGTVFTIEDDQGNEKERQRIYVKIGKRVNE